jgi:hypothetical protein
MPFRGTKYRDKDTQRGCVNSSACEKKELVILGTQRLALGRIIGSLAEFVGKWAVEKAASWKSPRAGLFHCA